MVGRNQSARQHELPCLVDIGRFVAVLTLAPGSLLLVEHPETGLHAKAQVKLGELFSLAASAGIQVILETHSDHLFNGIRQGVHDGKLAPDEVQINFRSLEPATAD